MPLPPDFPVSPHDILDPNTRWWFQEEHLPTGASGIAREFRYYFAQREAIETIIYLYEVAAVKDKVDLIRFDSSGEVSHNLFDEDWLRFVIKMATGSGKTKVLSIALAWCYFHKLYEPDSKIVKPSEFSPLSAQLFADVVRSWVGNHR